MFERSCWEAAWCHDQSLICIKAFSYCCVEFPYQCDGLIVHIALHSNSCISYRESAPNLGIWGYVHSPGNCLKLGTCVEYSHMNVLFGAVYSRRCSSSLSTSWTQSPGINSTSLMKGMKRRCVKSWCSIFHQNFWKPHWAVESQMQLLMLNLMRFVWKSYNHDKTL